MHNLVSLKLIKLLLPGLFDSIFSVFTAQTCYKTGMTLQRSHNWAKLLLLAEQIVTTLAQICWLERSKIWLWKKEFTKASSVRAMSSLIQLSCYQTSSWLVQALAELLWDGAGTECMSKLPKSLCVRGLLRSLQTSTAHTDSTFKLTGATAKLRSKYTCRHRRSKHTHAQMTDKVQILSDSHPPVCWPAQPLTAV